MKIFSVTLPPPPPLVSLVLFFCFIFSSCSVNEPQKLEALDENDQPLELREAGCGINLNDAGCSSILQYITTITTHPDYPGCSFEVSLNYVNCITDPGPFGQNNSILAGDFTIISHDCQQYSDDVSLATSAGDFALFEFVQEFDKLMLIELEVGLAIEADAVNECGQPQFSEITIFSASCYAICTKQILVGEFTFNSVVEIPCESSGCCARSSWVCFDPITQTYIQETRGGAILINGQPSACLGSLYDLGSDPGTFPFPEEDNDEIYDISDCTYITKCNHVCD